MWGGDLHFTNPYKNKKRSNLPLQINSTSLIIFSDILNTMKEKNINSNQLSKLTGIYSSTIAMFLTRKNRTIRLENLLYICDALGIRLSEFFSDKRFDEAEANEWRKKPEQ